MFYDIYKNLCESIGKSATAVAIDLDISRGTVSNWKNKGASPNGEILQKIADYFDISVDYLLSGETKKSPDTMSEDEEIMEYLNELKNNPGMRILFSKAKGATKEDLEKVVKMIEIMRGDTDGGYYI